MCSKAQWGNRGLLNRPEQASHRQTVGIQSKRK
jgi:hypothetical protein